MANNNMHNKLSPDKNPLTGKWSTPYETPPFQKIKPDYYLPAFKSCIREAKQDIEHIKDNPEEPTFKNTIVPIERSGFKLDRVAGIFFNLLECDATDEMQDVAVKVQPLLTRYTNDLYLDPVLFQRVRYVYDREIHLLHAADRMLLERTHDAFVSHGAGLSATEKKKFNELSLQLADLILMFSRNALAATNACRRHITQKTDLKGLPDNELAIAAQRAKENNMDGYLFDLSAPSVNAILKYADNRELRREMYLHSCNKACLGEYDNTEIIKKILRCRYQIAQLLGYENYARYALHDRMAENTENVYKLLDRLAEVSLPAAQKEMEALIRYARTTGFEERFERWDLAYYQEKQQAALFNFDTETLKPYFKLESVIDGIFKLAGDLYDLNFVENRKIETYHPDVRAYEVYQTGNLKAILYLDFYPRATKRSGAWMTAFREQYVDADGQDIRPLISLVMNFTPSTPDNPSLLSFEEVTTFLHEFGHALNGILSEVPYQSLSCTNSQHDFVELPSQLNENWAAEPEFLKTFAFHYKTGELIPQGMIEQLKAMQKYMAGYKSVRQLSFGYLDMMWHTVNPEKIENVRAMEHGVFASLDVLPEVPEACMSTSFSHIFSGGYAAGYYGYKWAEMLEADAFSLFKEKGVMNKTIATKYEDCILSRGGSQAGMEMFVNFRGRKPTLDALLKKNGLKRG